METLKIPFALLGLSYDWGAKFVEQYLFVVFFLGVGYIIYGIYGLLAGNNKYKNRPIRHLLTGIILIIIFYLFWSFTIGTFLFNSPEYILGFRRNVY